MFFDRALTIARLRLRSMFRARDVEAELAEEIRFHMDQMDERDRASAREIERSKEACRDMRRMGFIEDFFQDLRYGLRTLRASPGFTAVAVLTLTIGIGANTAIFSFVDALLFRPPNVADPGTLFPVYTMLEKDRRGSTSFTDFEALDAGSRKLEQFAASTRVALNWQGGEQAEIVWGIAATPNYFGAMGVAPALGRVFDRADGGAPVAVLENRFWRERFKSNPAVLGQSITLAARRYTIAGVMPEGFEGASTTFAPAVWIPLGSWSGITPEELHQPTQRIFEIVARPAAGAAVSEARAELATLSTHLPPIPNRPRENRRLVPMTIREARLSGDRTAAFIVSILAVVIGIVLLVASSNVAGLLLTRTLARRREIALRQSLGAQRFRIVRQLLTEGLLLSAIGAAGGSLVAWWAARLLSAYRIPSPVPIIFDATLDARTLIFTTVVAIAATLLFGLMPALEASRTDLIGRVRKQQQRVKRGLDAMVALQVAGGVVLLTGATLFAEALTRAASIHPGFTPERALAMTVDPSLTGRPPEQTANFYRLLLERARAIPGVQSAGLTQNIPLGFGGLPPAGVVIPGDSSNPLRTRYNVIDGDFFAAIGTRLLRGRPFRITDGAGGPPVAIVNESLARTLFPNRDAIGERLCLAGPPAECRQVIGVAEQGRYSTLAEESLPYFWVPLAQRPQTQMTLVIRTENDPLTYAAALRHETAALDVSLPIIELKTLTEHMRIPLLEPLLPAFFLIVLSGVGLLLSLAGIVGVTAYSVGSTKKEIGIRLALGAGRGQVLGAVLRRAMGVVALAIVLGIALSAGLGRIVGSLLYGLNPHDPVRLFGIALAMAIAMLAGSFWPAYSATKVDPALTLRED